jgi:BirA family biotin operon repressor/biotin-[acetyl-CoA-carboxylase] ligase
MPLPAGWRLARFAELPSTSDHLIRLAEAGEPAGLAVLADRQVAGRGRAGRQWQSPPGNLYLSALLRPATPAREAPQWSLLAGVALWEAVAPLLPDAKGLWLKWPNDLLLDGAKCAGILAETALGPEGRLAWLVLGIGVNLAMAPDVSGRRTAHLGAALAPAEFVPRLLARLAHWQAVQAAQGFAPVRAAWVAHGPEAGTPFALADGTAGAYAGLDDDGGLLLRQADGSGTRRVTAGEPVGT